MGSGLGLQVDTVLLAAWLWLSGWIYVRIMEGIVNDGDLVWVDIYVQRELLRLLHEVVWSREPFFDSPPLCKRCG